MNRNIIIALIIIFLIILAGIITFSQFATKADAEITFSSNASLKNGDAVEFQLTDAKGNPISNQNLSISFGANGTYEHYSIVTNYEGKGALVLNNEDSGNYNVKVIFDGNEQFNECNASQNITITGITNESYSEDTYTENTDDYSNDGYTEQTYSDSSSSDLTYDSELNVNYDSNGRVVGGQNDGADINELRNNPPNVVDGNLE